MVRTHEDSLREAATVRDDLAEEVAALARQILTNLEARPAVPNWGHVGSLSHALDLLRRAVGHTRA